MFSLLINRPENNIIGNRDRGAIARAVGRSLKMEAKKIPRANPQT
jgi:hypothetical protein